MKRVSTLDVKVDDSLQIKRCLLVLTSHGDIARSKERTEEENKLLLTMPGFKRYTS